MCIVMVTKANGRRSIGNHVGDRSRERKEGSKRSKATKSSEVCMRLCWASAHKHGRRSLFPFTQTSNLSVQTNPYTSLLLPFLPNHPPRARHPKGPEPKLRLHEPSAAVCTKPDVNTTAVVWVLAEEKNGEVLVPCGAVVEMDEVGEGPGIMALCGGGSRIQMRVDARVIGFPPGNTPALQHTTNQPSLMI